MSHSTSAEFRAAKLHTRPSGRAVAITRPCSRMRTSMGCAVRTPSSDAGIAQLVEHDLAKVGVASSSLVSRSSHSSTHGFLHSKPQWDARYRTIGGPRSKGGVSSPNVGRGRPIHRVQPQPQNRTERIKKPVAIPHTQQARRFASAKRQSNFGPQGQNLRCADSETFRNLFPTTGAEFRAAKLHTRTAGSRGCFHRRQAVALLVA